MEIEVLGDALLVIAGVVLAAVLGVRLASRLGLPGLLLFLGIGLLLDSAVPGLDFSDAKAGRLLGYAALVVILAEGGLTTRFSDVRPVLAPAALLASLGVFASIAAVAMPLVLFGLEPRIALLLAAVVSSTDAAAVFSVLRRVSLPPRLRALQEAESGFNDAPVVVLVVVLSEAGADEVLSWRVPIVVALQLIGGAAVGIAVGMLGRWLLPRLALPAAGLYPLAVMALLFGAYGAADVLRSSGFLATYIAGVLVGNAPGLPHRRSVVGFAEGMAWSAQIALFVMLGLLADVPRALGQAHVALIAGLALVLLGRPAAALSSLVWFRLPGSWVGFTALVGMRGAVPIVFAAIPLGAGLPGAEVVFDATLLIVVALTLLQAPTLGRITRLLRLQRGPVATELAVESAPLDEIGALLLGVEVPSGSKLAGVYIGELRLPPQAVVSLIIRQGEALPPDLHTRLRPGDRVLIVTTADQAQTAVRRLRLISQWGRLAGWSGPTAS